MLGILATIATALGLGSFVHQLKRPLSEKVRAGDSVFVNPSALTSGVPGSAVADAELAIFKTLMTGRSTVRVDDVFPDTAKGGGARGLILPTPNNPTTSVRFPLSAVQGIERPDDKHPDGFITIT